MNPSPARDQQFVVVVRRRPYCLEEVSRVDAGSRQGIPHGRDHGVRIAPDAREINLDIVRAFRCGSKRKAEAAVDRPDLLVALAAPFETERPGPLPRTPRTVADAASPRRSRHHLQAEVQSQLAVRDSHFLPLAVGF